tara:strand:- start:1272 stop:1385 length:114 start_codon:yes stop_codon:yes gene_type:complete
LLFNTDIAVPHNITYPASSALATNAADPFRVDLVVTN